MRRRVLSTGVQVRAARSQAARERAILAGKSATVSLPTDKEMREALARLIRDLEDMRIARTAGEAGWAVMEGSFAPQVITTAEGEVVLRGGIVIERAD